MRIRVSSLFIALSALLITIPAWAAHVDATEFTPATQTTIGTASLSPGSYELRAQEGSNQLQIVQNGKVISEVPCQWEQLPQKAHDSEVLTSNNVVQEIHFSGRTAAVKIGSAQGSQGQ